MNNNKLQPAIIGGVALFGMLILTAIIQHVFPTYLASILGCCNCLWPIAGGALAAFLYIKKSATPVRTGDGAILGALAGAIGGVLYLIIGTPVNYFLNHARMEEQFENLRQLGWSIPENLTVFPLMIIGGVLGVIVYAALATIGGLIGIPLFEKRKDGGASAPPPPQNYGGPTGGYGGADYASPPNTAAAPPSVAPPNFNEPPTGSSGSSL